MAVVALGAVAWLGRGPLFSPLLVRALSSFADDALEGELAVGAVEGSWLTELVLRDVTFEGRSTLSRLRAERIAVRYSIPGLLRGDPAWLESIEARCSEVAVDLAAPRRPRPDPEPDERTAPPEFLPAVDVTVDRASVAVDDTTAVALSGLTARAVPGGADPAGPGAGSAERPEPCALFVGGDATLRTSDGSWTGALALEGAYDRGALAIERLAAGSLVVAPARADLRALGDRRVDFSASLAFDGASGAAAAGRIAGAWDTGTLRANANVAGLQLADLRPLAALVPALDDAVGRVALDGEVELVLEPALDVRASRAELSLVVDQAAVRGFVLDHLDGRARIAGGDATVESLSARQGVNELHVEDLVVPLAADGPLAVLATARGRLRVSLEDVPALLRATGESGALARLPRHDVELTADLANGVLTLGEGSIETADGQFVVRRGELELPRSAAAWGDARCDVDFDLAFGNVAHVAALVGRDGWSGSLEGGLRLEGRLASPEGRFDLHASALVAEGFDVGDARAVAVLHDGRLVVERIEASSPGWDVSGGGTWDLGEERLEGVDLTARIAQLASLDERLEAGTAELALQVAGPLSAPVGRVRALANGVRAWGIEDGAAFIEADFEGFALHVSRLSIELPEGTSELVGSGSWDPESGAIEATLDSLVLRREGEALVLREPVRALVRAGEARVDPFELSGGLGSLRGALDRGDGRLRATLEAADFRPTPLFAAAIPGDFEIGALDGTLEVTLADGALSAACDLRARGARFSQREEAWTCVLVGVLRDERLEVTELRAESPGLGTVRAFGSVPFAPLGSELLPEGHARAELVTDELQLEAVGELVGVPLAGTATLDAHFSGPWSALRGSLALRGSGLDAWSLENPDARVGPLDVEVELTVDERIELDRVLVSSPTIGTWDGKGSLGASLDVASFAERGLGVFEDAAVDLESDLQMSDLSWLAKRTDAVRRCGGHVQGRLRITGTVAAPRFDGSLRLQDGELRLAADFPPMLGVAGTLDFNGSRVELHELSGEFGGSPFRMEGSVALGDVPELDVRLSGENLLLIRTRDTKVRANADLAVTGPLSSLWTRGKVTVTDGRFGRKFDLLAGLSGGNQPPRAERGLVMTFWREPPLAEMNFEVAVDAARPFIVKNNLVNGAMRPQLTLVGTGEVPVLNGTIIVDPTRLSLPSGTLHVDSGLIQFRQNDPFVPQLELSAKTRLLGYDITAYVTGPYDEPEIELSSIPPLPQEDLLVLFLTGTLPSASDGNASREAATTVALYFAKDLLSSWLASDSEDEGLLDRVEFVVGADVSRTGAQTWSVKYFINETDKGTGLAHYALAERDVYDKVNYGYGFRFRFQ